MDLPLQLVPVLDLQQRATTRLIVGSALLPGGFVDFFKVPGQLCDHFPSLALVQCEAREPTANQVLPIRHRPPSRAAAALEIVPPIPRAAAQASSSPPESAGSGACVVPSPRFAIQPAPRPSSPSANAADTAKPAGPAACHATAAPCSARSRQRASRPAPP